MKNNLPPTLEKKLINRNTLLPNTERSYSSTNSIHHDAASHRRTLVIGQGIRILGTLEDVETLIIEGSVETNTIKTKNIIVQKTGILKGEVDSQDIEITGTLEGNITAQGNLVVTATGRLIGQAKCRRLKVEDGGQITGQIEMITADKLKVTPTSTEIETKKDQESSMAEDLLKTTKN
ncbi:polymer-forming cytoskeletal protein [Commensalibacter papalotli (ex Botero et al. 2024)]|uniref:Bactofilin family (CcmA) (PDB:2N3D) n=1 Tax=Commensalibacter papalotli (ex Botero et al. 2024) TaxID=2972766 RepID=A0ABN8WIQ5_9PROT|nr:polymer-forming cytoskeletal protein [Commensalibacter papalotli (ex Botero et al. 2024)]CAI3954413.1 Cytoskeletal protein CcmA [Commensalibacter papalotli (ex Botero et al. 2024)]CAI3954924.1 Cytoskeletal protein CcmA [Commensalibacter papalotli (ex Botero et al. 2024)]